MSKIVLVTGCRSGFGKLTALRAARAGHTVYAGLRDVQTGEDLRAEAAGLPLTVLQLDVTLADDRASALAQILDQHGRLDALVNNAGVALGGFLEMVDEDELRRVFEVNLFGLWALTRACLPALRAHGDGVLVNISSMSGRMAFPGLGVYASSKHALEGMSEAWRHELRPFGVRVHLVEPGAYSTDIFTRNRCLCRAAHREGSPYAAMDARLDVLAAKVAARAAKGRDPEDVAACIVELVEGRRRGLRHPMGADAKLRVLLLRLAPFGLVEWILGRAVGLTTGPTPPT